MIYPKLQIMIDYLENLDNSPNSKCGFDMNYEHESHYTDHPCGTACCIGGHAELILGGYHPEDPEVVEALSRLCNIPVKIANKICWPGSRANCPEAYEATLEQAIKVLEICRDTGKVDWPKALGSP